MSRKGRKRKNVSRQPNGQPRRNREPWDDPVSVARVRKLREEAWTNAKDPYRHYPLGLLMVTNAITTEQFNAGRSYATTAWRYSQIQGIALPKCKAIDWEGRHGLSLASEPDPDEAARVITERHRVFTLLETIHKRANEIMRQVCICDEETAEVSLLKRCLDAVAEFRSKGRKAA